MLDNNTTPDASLDARQEDAGLKPQSDINFNGPDPKDNLPKDQGYFQDNLVERDQVVGADVAKYAPYTGYITHLAERDAIAARNQSTGEKWMNGIYQGLYGEVVGGGLMGFGALAMKVTGEKNLLFELGNAMSEGSREDAPIFKHTNDTFAFNDAGWWTSNLGNLFSAASMLLPGMAAARGAAMAGRGIAAVGKAGRIAKALKAGEKGVDAAGLAMREAGRSAKIERRAAQLGGALAMRHAENIREGVDVLAQAEEEFLQDPRSLEEFQGNAAWDAFDNKYNRAPRNKEELARFVGGQAAVRSYQVNSSNIFFDLIQMGAILKPFKAVTRGKGITGAAAKKAGKAATGINQGTRLSRFSDVIKGPLKKVGEAATEGIEESINFIGNAEGAAYGEQLRDIETGNFADRLNDYLQDDHMYESAFFGFLGGGVFQGAAAVLGKKQNAALVSMQRTQEQIVKKTNELQAAQEKGDSERVRQIQKEILNDMGTRAAQSGRVDQLLEQLNSEEFMAQLQEQGMLGEKTIEDARKELIEGVLKQEERYKKARKLQEQLALTDQEMHVVLSQTSAYESALEEIDKELETIDDAALTPEQKLASKFLLRDFILESNQKLKKGEKYQNQAELDALEAELKDKERPENMNSMVSAPAVRQALLGFNKTALKRQLAEITTPAALNKLRKEVNEYNDKQEERVQEAFKKSVKEETDINKLESQLTSAKRNKRTEAVTLLEERIAELKEAVKEENKVEEDIEGNEEGEDGTKDETEDNQEEDNQEEDNQEEDLPLPEGDLNLLDLAYEALKLAIEDLNTITLKKARKILSAEGIELSETEVVVVLAELQTEGLLTRIDAGVFEVVKEESNEDKPDEDKPVEEEPPTEEDDLSKLTRKALLAIAKTEGLKGYSKLKKAELIEAIRAKRDQSDLFDDPPKDEEETTQQKRARRRLEALEKALSLSDSVEVLNALQAIYNHQRLADERGVSSEFPEGTIERAQELEKGLEELEGYTIYDHQGKNYDGGLLLKADFVLDDSLEPGTLVITKVNKPEIRLNGKLVQPADVIVSQGPPVEVPPEVNEVEAPQGQVKLAMVDLMQAFLKQLQVGGSVTAPSTRNVEHVLRNGSTLTLTPEESLQYEALMFALTTPNAKVTVQLSNTDFAGNIYGRTGRVAFKKRAAVPALKNLTAKEEREGVSISVEEDNTSDYEIVVEYKGQEVRLGYVPRVGRLLTQAQRLQTLYENGQTEGETENQTYWRDAYANANLNAIRAVQHADSVAQLREFLEAQQSGKVVLNGLAKGTAFDGSSRRGSLLRPRLNNLASLSEHPDVVQAIQEEGICVMLYSQKDGVKLFNLKNQQQTALPYQDGVMGKLDDYSLRQNGNSSAMGAMFIPVPDPGNGNKIMWVRLPDMTLQEVGLVDMVQGVINDPGLNPDQRIERLGQYMSIAPWGAPTVNDGFTGAQRQSDNRIILFSKGKPVLQIDTTGSVVGGRTLSKEVLGAFKFRIGTEQGKVGAEKANYQKSLIDPKTGVRVKALEDSIINNGKMPIAPVMSSEGKVLGYHHPVPAPRIPPSESDTGKGRLNQNFNPETQSTQLPIAIDMSQIPDSTSVTGDGTVVDPNDPKDKAPLATESDDNSAFSGGPAFMTVERAMVSDLNVQASEADQQAAEAWMAENLPHVPFRRVKGLITRGGITAYGIWEQGMVSVSDIAVVGTEFHEAFHAVMDTYLPDSRKAKILAEAKKKYGDLSAIELEEKLAEAFREYVLTEGLSMKDKSAIRRFFSEIAALIKAMFQGQYRTRQLMQQINKGKYAYKPSARSTGFMTKFSKAPAFSVSEIKELDQLMPLLISGVYGALQPALQSDNPIDVINKQYPKEEDKEIREAMIQIAKEIKDLTEAVTEESYTGDPDNPVEEEDNQPTPRQRRNEIAMHVMETIFNERGYIQRVMSMSQSSPEMVEQMRERLRSGKGALIAHFSTSAQAQRLVMQGLRVDATTGTTAAEQYGGSDMAEINPMDKVPASIKNMIAKTVFIPAAYSGKLIDAVTNPTNDTKTELIAEAEALKNKGTKGYENLHDVHSHFGLPRFLSFESVYPYLLYHLSYLPTYEAMEAKMIKLSQYNPSLAMIVMQLEANPSLQKQFYVGMKRASSEELTITTQFIEIEGQPVRTVNRRDTNVMSPQRLLVNHNKERVMDSLKRLNAAQRTNGGAALKNALKNDTTHDRKVNLAIRAMDALGIITQDPAARNNTLSLLNTKQIDATLDALSGLYTKEVQQEKNIAAALGTVVVASNLHLADMGAVHSSFLSLNKSKFAHMNPCYLTELLDALNHGDSQTNQTLLDKVEASPELEGSLWYDMITNEEAGNLSYRRIGNFEGKAYADMTLPERLEYDVLALLKMEKGQFVSGYSPVPTPSDATGSYVVKNDFLMFGTEYQDKILAKIYDAESRVMHKSLPIKKGMQTQQDKANHIRELLQAEANEMLNFPEAREVYKKTSQFLGNMPVETIALNHVMGTYVSNWNVSNWVGGTIDHFGGDVTKYQKRFKHIQSPGQSSADKGTFKNVTIEDPQTTESWATTVKYKNGKPVVGKDGKYVLENAPIDRADAQSYVTLDFFERMLESHGEMTPYKQAIFEKARNREPLTVNERSVFAPYKPFYFGWIGSQPHQIKNSVIPLLPPVKGQAPISAELEAMRQWMEADGNKVDQITLKSAHKIGVQGKATVMFDADGKFTAPADGYTSYEMPMEFHRNQVSMVEHAQHGGKVGLGSQTTKIITGNLRSYEGLGQEMIDKLLDVEQRMYDIKLKEFKGTLFIDNGQKDSSTRTEVDIVKLREYIQDRLRDDVHPAILDLLDSKEYHSRNAPMVAFALDAALKAAVEADYNGMKVPGGQQVQIADLGHVNPENGQPLEGMRVIDGKVLPAEVKINRKFLPAKYREMSIEEIRKIDPAILEVMVYRVPAESKNSMAVCRVVDFLPAGQDGIVIPAAFVAQMGSDFDIDKLFVNWQKRAAPGKILNKYDKTANEHYRLQREVLMTPEVVTNEVLKPQGFETIKAFRTENQQSVRKLGNTDINQHMKNYPYGAMTHLQLWSDNMAGVGLKGMAADNNAFWLQMQRYGYSIETIDMSSLPLEILQWNAEAVAASMDGAKDPVWGTMGINSKNFAFFMYECTMEYMRRREDDKFRGREHNKQRELRFAREAALKVATDPAVLEQMDNWEMDQQTSPELEVYRRYQNQIKKQGTMHALKRIANVSKLKSKELEKSLGVEVAVRGLASDQMTQQDVDGLADNFLKKPVIEGGLAMAETTRRAMNGLGIYFYDTLANLNTDFQTYVGVQIATMADEYAELYGGKEDVLGERGTDGKLRDVDLTEPRTWGISQWLKYFHTDEAGKKIVEDNPALQRMLLHISADGSYEVDGKRYDRVSPIQLSDPINQAEFRKAWNELFNPPDQYDGPVHYPSTFAKALVSYEAARSGWRKSDRFNFSSHLPNEIFKSRPLNDIVTAESIAAYKVLDPRVRRVNTLKKALFDKGIVKFNGDIYITIEGGTRSKVKAPKNTIGFRGVDTIEDLSIQLVDNTLEVQEAIDAAKEKMADKKKQSRSAFGGKAEGTAQRITHLQNRFAQYGVKVKVVMDASLDSAGEVVYDSKTGVIRLHPDRMKSDTVVHEFAHIYVEMLGYENPAVQAAIQELRNTPLFAEIQALYPDLSTRNLEMEVLVTAMGIEGDAIFEKSKNPGKLRTLINKLLRALGKLVGIPPNTARELVRDMIGGTSPKVAALGSFRAEQRLSESLSATELVNEVSNELINRVDHMRRLGASTVEQEELLDSIASMRVHRIKNIVGNKEMKALDYLTEDMRDFVSKSSVFLENAEEYLAKSTVGNLTKEDINLMNQAYQLNQIYITFQQSFASYESLKDPSEEMAETNKKFRELNSNVNTIQTRLNKLVKNTLSQKLAQNSTNPKVQEAVEAGLNIFSLAQSEFSDLVTDTTATSVQFLGVLEQDSNIVLTLFGKTIRNVVNTEELNAKNDIAELRNILDKYENAGGKIEDLLEKDNKSFLAPIKSGFWVQESKATDRRRWRAKNMVQKYLPEYYLEHLYKPSEKKIRELEFEISKYKQAVDQGQATEEDKAKLVEMEEAVASAKQESNTFLKFHEPTFDLESFEKDRKEAQEDPDPLVLAAFDATYRHEATGNPKFNTKYHTGNKVKDKYLNKDWTGTDVPVSKWMNPKVDELTPLQVETIAALTQLMQKAYGVKDHRMFTQALIPQIEKPETKSVTETLRDMPRKAIEINPDNERMTTDSNGRKIFMRGGLRHSYRSDNDVSTDLRATIGQFIVEARAAQASNNIETFSLMTRDQLSDMELTARKGWKVSFEKGQRSAERNQRATIKGERSNSMDMIEHVLEGYLGEGWHTKGTYDKQLAAVQGFTSWQGLAINPSAWINNFMYGELQQILDAQGGDMYSSANLKKAGKEIFKHVIDLAKSRDKGVMPDSQIAAVMHFFDATMDQRELPEGAERMSKLFDYAYIGQSLGEVIMQSQVVLAMMYETEVVYPDGSTSNLYEAIEWNPSMGRNIKFKEGLKVKRKDGTQVDLDMAFMGSFKTKSVAVLQRIHGAYNTEDMGRFHRKAVGRLVLQFRKWMPQALKKRFGAELYSESREQDEIGYYRALWMKVIIPTIMGSEGQKRTRFLSTFRSQDKYVQIAAKRAMLEIAMGVSSALLSYVLASMIEIDSEDDDEYYFLNDEYYKAKLLYHSARLSQELNSYTPWGMYDTALRIGQDPTASLRQFKTLGKLLYQIGLGIIPGVDLERFQGGQNYGDLKITKYALDLPAKAFMRGANTISQHQIYKLS